MVDRPVDLADVRIGAMTVRGPGLSRVKGQALATAVAAAVARQVGVGATVEHLAVRLPATVFAADGGVDHVAISDAIGRQWRSATDA